MPVYRSKFFGIGVFLTISLSIVAYAAAEHAEKVKNLPAGENVLWSDPGDVSKLDFVYGAGGQDGAPSPPFHFIEEDLGGTTPKIKVKDSKDREWSVKFGVEARPSVFSTRLVWACGYVVETEYFVQRGAVDGVHGLKRAQSDIQGDGTFSGARFQLRAKTPRFLTGFNWAWTSNPFVGTRELNGLKVLTMLLSNWDTKDARDLTGPGGAEVADSNLAIFQMVPADKPRYEYFVSDWGASLGKWGAPLTARSKGNCRDFSAQTPHFVQGDDSVNVRFGFVGKHNDSIVSGIRTGDVQWLMQYLGRVTDDQLRQGLASSGATPDEMECYLTSLRQRINQLKAITPK